MPEYIRTIRVKEVLEPCRHMLSHAPSPESPKVREFKKVASYGLKMSLNCLKIEEVEVIAKVHWPIVQVKPFRRLRVGAMVTGSEVYEGIVEDGLCLQCEVCRYPVCPFG